MNRPELGRVRLVVLVDDEQEPRPRTRGECADGPRPCPWVSCKYNLYLDIAKDGGVRLNFPEQEPDELRPEWSCVLDIADRGGISLEDLGAAMNITRERARQIEETALNRTLRRARLGALGDFDEGGGVRQSARNKSYAKAEPEPSTAESDSPVEEPRGPVSFFADGEEVDDRVCGGVWTLLAKKSKSCRSTAVAEAVVAEPPSAPEVIPACEEERGLTRRERALLKAYREHLTTYGIPPSRIELGMAVGISLANKASIRSAVYQATRRLVGRGLIPKGERGGTKPERPKTEAWVPASEPVLAVLIAKRDQLLHKARTLDAAIDAISTDDEELASSGQ